MSNVPYDDENLASELILLFEQKISTHWKRSSSRTLFKTRDSFSVFPSLQEVYSGDQAYSVSYPDIAMYRWTSRSKTSRVVNDSSTFFISIPFTAHISLIWIA